MFPKMGLGIALRKSLLWRKFLGESVGVHHEQIFFKEKWGKNPKGHTSFSL